MSDLIDRAQAQTELQFAARRYTVAHEANGEGKVVWSDNLISVTDAIDALRKAPSAQLGTNCISRQAAIEALDEQIAFCDKALKSFEISMKDEYAVKVEKASLVAFREILECLPPAEPEKRTDKRTETHARDSISRQQAIEAINHICPVDTEYDCTLLDRVDVRYVLLDLPAAQPERRCVNCGRTVNNGGWYEDGRTRCPIEEHYALPKDGYCHLWEKRKDWEDDYVKRAEEGEK